MSKPNPERIQRAAALSEFITRPRDPIVACNVCGLPSEQLGVWREHDEHDRPLPNHTALVYIAKDHEACLAKMEAHPRLYEEVTGLPGTFPKLCGPCVHRDGFGCTHPALKRNGGEGLSISLSGLNAIICRRGGGCAVPLKHAERCVGRWLISSEPLAASQNHEEKP